MREIKFRGKRLLRNDRKIFKGQTLWVYGNLIKVTEKYITDLEGNDISNYEYKIQVNGHVTLTGQTKKKKSSTYIVDEKTVGQYTGIKDMNKIEIYEGDRVYIRPEDEYGEIIWDNETARFLVVYDDIITDFDNWYGYDLEVVGTIYEE